MLPTASQPSSPADRPPAVILDTRLPGSGEAATLIGHLPVYRQEGAEAEPLAMVVRRGLAWLGKQGPGALLVGSADYPHDPHAPGSRITLLGFDRHERLASPAARALARIRGASAPAAFSLTGPFRPGRTPADYEAGVRRIQDLLRAGDAYQVNIAQRFSAPCAGEPLGAWLALRARFNPPWSAWVDLGHRQVLSLSPECFLAVQGRSVLTFPIKGTRPRGRDAASDRLLRDALENSPKDRAENLMIVDLLRNDLGRVCRAGSVQTPVLFEVQSFPNVHHLVSTVRGELGDGKDLADLLAACFPGGSITGAPKRRAREIIRELEPGPRGIYCGSVFWIDGEGQMGSNIAIRTLSVENGQIDCWGGAGIVADSDPAQEQQECLDKVGPLMRFVEDEFLL